MRAARAGQRGWRPFGLSLRKGRDVTELPAAMEVELSRSVDEVQVMGDAACARVLKRHSIDTEAAKLAALVRDVCEVSRIT